jgi:hypothetical protein
LTLEIVFASIAMLLICSIVFIHLTLKFKLYITKLSLPKLLLKLIMPSL